MGQLVAILLMITLTPHGSTIHHIKEYSVTYDKRISINDITVRQKCEMDAAIGNAFLDLTKQIFVCRTTRIFPEGTEFVN